MNIKQQQNISVFIEDKDFVIVKKRSSSEWSGKNYRFQWTEQKKENNSYSSNDMTHVSKVVHCFWHKLNKFTKSTRSTALTRNIINDPFGRVNKFFIKFLTFYPFLLFILLEVEHDAFFSLHCSFYSFYSNILSFMENFLFVRSHSSFCSHSITWPISKRF